MLCVEVYAPLKIISLLLRCLENELSSNQKEPEREVVDNGYQMKRSKLNDYKESGRMDTLEDEGDYNDMMDDDGNYDNDDDNDDDMDDGNDMQNDSEDNKIDVDINVQKDDEEYELNKKFDVRSYKINK